MFVCFTISIIIKKVILATAKSKNGILIRLTDERWKHITSSHIELTIVDFNKIIKIVKNPIMILNGDFGELLAVGKFGRKKWVVVIYKEVHEDGFIITSYLTTDLKWLLKRKIIWTNK